MEVKEYIEKVSGRKGQNVKAVWQRPMKIRKGVEHVVEKRTAAIIRTGIDYENMQSVKEGRANGDLPEENQGLPWGEWAQFPYHIQHKEKDYLRLYPASGINVATGEGFIPEVSYFLDGVEVSKEVVMPLCLASEFRTDSEPPLVFTIKAGDLVEIGNSN